MCFSVSTRCFHFYLRFKCFVCMFGGYLVYVEVTLDNVPLIAL